jgi:hypothetical protein
MNDILLILGNGFDLQCGLKSSYRNYFSSSFYEPCLELSQKIDKKYFLGEFRGGEKLISNYSIWDLYFYCCFSKQSMTDSDTCWFNVEDAIANSLLTQPNGSCPTWYQVLADYNDQSIREEKRSLVGLMEYFIRNYTGLSLSSISTSNFCLWLLDELKVFENRFGIYIKQECDSLSFQEKAKEIVRTISYENSGTVMPNNVNIETFNFSRVSSLGRTFRSINGDFNNPIFGIAFSKLKDSLGKDTIVSSDDRYIFTKTARQMDQMASLTNKSSRGIANNQDIYVYGHSLDEQDYNYFYSLFDWIGLANPNLKSKLIFCYSKYIIDDPLKQDKWIKNYERSIAKLIESYGNMKNSNETSYLLDSLINDDNLRIGELTPIMEKYELKFAKP